MQNIILNSLKESRTVLDNLISDSDALDQIEAAAECLINSLSKGNKIFACGNGGSMCDAMHFAEELTGRFRKDRIPYPAVAINDPSHISCVSNDYGYDQIFSRYIEAHGRKDDVLFAISTSGKSKTIINAAVEAKKIGMKTVVLSGKTNPELLNFSDNYIVTKGAEFSDRVQELHIKVIHILIELIEREFHPENY